jgi:putative transposase
LASAFKKSVNNGGTVVFADEVGFLMNPCVKATWAPRRNTPVVQFRNRHHRKVSALGALALAADLNIKLLIDWHPDTYVRAPQAADFVVRLLKEIDGPVTLVWDKLQAHRSKLVKQLANDNPRLSIVYLPSYAPDLNPAEGIWCLTKYHRMANHSLDTLEGLLAEAQKHVADVAKEQSLLLGCFKGAKLSLALN